jgi:hypothetical protein
MGSSDDRTPPLHSHEEAWFQNPGHPLPLRNQLDERHGWHPPSSWSGVVFALVSLLLVTLAIGGTVFFLTPAPDAERHSSAPTTTPEPATTLNSGDLGVTPTPAVPMTVPSASASSPQTEATATAPPPVKPVPVRAQPVRAVPRPNVRAARPRWPEPKPREAEADRAAPAETTLPDLDRAAAAQGMRAHAEDLFDTPSGVDAPPAASSPSPPAAEIKR